MTVVLIVDDSSLARMIVRRCLTSIGLQDVLFREASDGVDALVCLRAHPIDVVVSDLNMPNLDGVGLLAAMREDPQLRHTPFIVSSSVVSEAKSARLRELGAVVVVLKPVSPAPFRELLHVFMRGAA